MPSPPPFFLDGSSEEALLKSFAAIYRRITKAPAPQTKDSGITSETVPLEDMPKRVIHWLSHAENNAWLLIFDNVDKEPTDGGGADIVSYFPPRDHGSILITTRLARLSNLGRSKRVRRMTKEEAMHLLNESLCGSNQARGNEGSLAKKWLLETLDGLPLAISQAGRFIHALNLRPDTYLELYTSSRQEVIDTLPSSSLSVDSDKASIRTTWMTSLTILKDKASAQGLGSDCYAALQLLQLFAYFEPSDLTYNTIRFGLIGNNIPDWFTRTFGSKIRFFAVIKILLDLCLIDNNISEGSYSMHRVVHDWLCVYVCGKTDQELLRLAMAGISYSTPLIKTHEWIYEQQQLAFHAVHILPRLETLRLDDHLVRYDEMTTAELGKVAFLLDQPAQCWSLMRFDHTLIGITRLLQSCGRRQDALCLIRDALSRCPKFLANGNLNATFAILKYEECSCRCSFNADSLISVSEMFSNLGSPSWTAKTLNLCALQCQGSGSMLLKNANNIWARALYKSREDTGSIFVHPTWMIFSNLYTRLAYKDKIELLEDFEEEARSERQKVNEASQILCILEKMRRPEVIQYDHGKALANSVFERTGSLERPLRFLRSSLLRHDDQGWSLSSELGRTST